MASASASVRLANTLLGMCENRYLPSGRRPWRSMSLICAAVRVPRPVLWLVRLPLLMQPLPSTVGMVSRKHFTPASALAPGSRELWQPPQPSTPFTRYRPRSSSAVLASPPGASPVSAGGAVSDWPVMSAIMSAGLSAAASFGLLPGSLVSSSQAAAVAQRRAIVSKALFISPPGYYLRSRRGRYQCILLWTVARARQAADRGIPGPRASGVAPDSIRVCGSLPRNATSLRLSSWTGFDHR